jgi:prefoldin subunit 5
MATKEALAALAAQMKELQASVVTVQKENRELQASVVTLQQDNAQLSEIILTTARSPASALAVDPSGGRLLTEAIRSISPFVGESGFGLPYMSPIAFIRKVEDLAVYKEIKDDTMVRIFADKLGGRALVWWHYYSSAGKTRMWGEARKAFLCRWQMQAHSERALEDKLYGDARLRQSTSSLEDLELLLAEFHTTLEALSTSATKPPPSEESLVGILWGMLHSDLQDALKNERRKCRTVEDLQQVALDAAVPARSARPEPSVPMYPARTVQTSAHSRAPVAMLAGGSPSYGGSPSVQHTGSPAVAYAPHRIQEPSNSLENLDPAFVRELAFLAQEWHIANAQQHAQY